LPETYTARKRLRF